MRSRVKIMRNASSKELEYEVNKFIEEMETKYENSLEIKNICYQESSRGYSVLIQYYHGNS